MDPDDFESAHAEWAYETVEGQFGQDHDVAYPCQLRFTEPTDQDLGRFHDALEDRGFAPLDKGYCDRSSEDRPIGYDGEVCSKEHYNRVRILAMRGDVVRLFPHDDYVPTPDELVHLANAIEAGFDAPLEHAPIDREGE